MEKKYTEKEIENILKSLKHKEILPKSDFTLSAMQRIKNDSSFDDDIMKLDETDDMLECLAFIDEVKPSDNFTNNVMAKIKTEQTNIFLLIAIVKAWELDEQDCLVFHD